MSSRKNLYGLSKLNSTLYGPRTTIAWLGYVISFCIVALFTLKLLSTLARA
ncbi:hypothetical protein [Vulcanisaeta sp. JCM 16161]|uniref:hypothetical protein n=1 Tax=Vulcanisaeta sp. JCM 16161 TaxID=1295372 RepID=UPI001FB1F68C|nr:hypothetical protein [Vulcanisaeta sp. JCM 16161]